MTLASSISRTLLLFAACGTASAQYNAPLPNAPSTTIQALPPPPQNTVNGRYYRRPTRHEDLLAYRRELIGPRPFISAAIRSAIEQSRPRPIGWGQDFPGYLQRYGSAYSEFAIDSSVRYGLASISHEDVRYLICHECSTGAKVKNAVLAEFTARHGEDGRRTFSPTPIVAGMSGPLIAYSAWYPPGYGPGDAAGHAAFGFGFPHRRSPRPRVPRRQRKQPTNPQTSPRSNPHATRSFPQKQNRSPKAPALKHWWMGKDYSAGGGVVVAGAPLPAFSDALVALS